DTPVAAASKPEQPTEVGRYRIENRLGAGGMGVVYTAHDPELDRMVAVKLLRHAGADSEGSQARDLARRRLLREARAMARLAHPNVIHVYDVGSFGDQVFVAMELVDGVDLAKWLRREPRTFDQILDCYLLAGEGLCAAHDAGLVHRDFKPENVLVARDGRVRVLDFGLARSAEAETNDLVKPEDAIDTGAVTVASEAGRPRPSQTPRNTPKIDLGDTHVQQQPAELDVSAATVASGADARSTPLKPERSTSGYRPALTSFTRTGAVLGTPRYMSPEQVLGKSAEAPSDQFSFCVAVYEAAYQQTAFPSTGLHAYLDDIIEGNLRPPPDEADAPPWLWPILARGLSTDPDGRYPSMRALLVALAQARTPPVSPPAATQRSNMGIVAVATLAVVAAVAWGLRSQQQPANTTVPEASSAAKQPEAPTEPSSTGLSTGPSTGPSTGQVGSTDAQTSTHGPQEPLATTSDTTDASTGSSTAATGEQAHPTSTSPKTPTKNKRGWCAMHEDRYELLARTKRRKTTVKDRLGQCYSCRKETRASRIRRFQPDDCAHYQVCHPVENEACK
ncbi:MAG: protein kinase domain-containing protein, partial [Nannocystaceae bacterium]